MGGKISLTHSICRFGIPSKAPAGKVVKPFSVMVLITRRSARGGEKLHPKSDIRCFRGRRNGEHILSISNAIVWICVVAVRNTGLIEG